MRWLVGAFVLALVVSAPGVALAHGDERLVDGRIELAPGETVTFDGEVHYHRLVARIVADRPVLVRVIRTETDELVFEAGPGRDLSVNHLIACCDGRAWAPHRLVIENPGGSAAVVGATATFVHDDLAVMVYRAEAGTAESVVILGAIWALAVRRARRRRGVVAPRRAMRAALLVVGATGAIGVYGWLRYGSGSAPALIAGLADLPLIPVNPIVSRASLMMGVAMVGWAVAAARWVGTRHSLELRRSLWLGGFLVGVVGVSAWLIIAEYRATAMPLAMAVAAAAPLVVLTIADVRVAGRSSPGDGDRPHLVQAR